MKRLLLAVAFVLGLSASAWAASPTVVGTPTESNATADDASPLTVSRPAGVSGQLTIAILAVDGIPSLTWPSGYNVIVTESEAGNDWTLSIAYRWEDGTEGTTFDVTSSASEKWAAIVYSISGAENPSTQAPEATQFEGAASTTPDPPSITPTGGSKDYLFIVAVLQNGEEADDDTWCNSPPTNYTPSPPRQKSSDIAGVAGTNVSVCSAERALNAASDDPGTFSVDLSRTYGAATIAVHPPGGAPPPATSPGWNRWW